MRAQEIVVEVRGMSCENCERHVREALRGVSGVSSAAASRAEGVATITADPVLATPERLRAAIEEAGYEMGDLRYPE